MTVFTLACLLLLTVSATHVVSASNFDAAWSSSAFVAASATYFGRDAWSLNIGSCGYGFVCPNRWSDELASGYDLVAISDQSPLYSGSHTGAQCGRCLEIKCRESSVTDGFGSRVERTSVCKNSASVKVKITDTCDCNFPANRQSNKRWCCGGTPHLDVSQWALDKIVDNSNRWGVFAVDYRPIGCKASLSNAAPAISLVKSPHDGDKPGTLDCSTQSYNSPGSSGVSHSPGNSHQRRANSVEAVSAQRMIPNRHSRKFYARRNAFFKVRKDKNPEKSIYWNIEKYYDQFNKHMRKTVNRNVPNPFRR